MPRFPPLSTGLAVPPGLDVDAHKHASIPYHRLFITSLAYSLTPNDVSQVFEAFGPIEFVDLRQDHVSQLSTSQTEVEADIPTAWSEQRVCLCSVPEPFVCPDGS